MCISGVCLSCLYDLSERQLHNNNARGINIQLHAHRLHIDNCWGVNCVIIPAPMVFWVGLTQRAQILKNFKIALRDWNFQARLKRMTFSSEIENFKRATHQTPIFVGNFKVKIENFKSEIEVFKRKLENFSLERLKFSSVQARLFVFFLSRFGPSGH